jgi:transposase
MDVHASSSTLAIVGPTGKRIRDFVLETNGKALVEAVTLVPGCRHLCLEEGTHSDWLYEILSPHVRRVVVLGQNQKRRGSKSDKLDAYDLAERLRVGNIDKSVFKPAGQFAELRALVRTYDKVVQDHTRAQNRLKALFRSRGIATPGRAVYRPEQRADWLAQLPGAMRTSARWLLTECDALGALHVQACRELSQHARQHAEVKLVQTVPGMGIVRSAQVVAVVVSPRRFRTKRQFWSYCGLGIVMRASAQWQRQDEQWVRRDVAQCRGLNNQCNRMLKSVFKSAAQTVLGCRSLDSAPLRAHYERLQAQGTKPNLAKLTIARKLAAIVLAAFKHQQAYDRKRLS